MIPQPDSVRFMPCATTRERVHARHDGELTSAEEMDLDVHLASCPRCARAAEAERGFLARVHGRIGIVRAPVALRARVRANIAGVA